MAFGSAKPFLDSLLFSKEAARLRDRGDSYRRESVEEQAWITRFHMREAIETLRFNPSEMKWIDFDMDLLLKVDTSNPDSDKPNGRSSILVNTRFAMQSITEGSTSTMTRNAEALMEAAHLDSDRYAAELPWLPWPDRRIEREDAGPFDYPAPGFDVEKPLAGQHIDEVTGSLVWSN